MFVILTMTNSFIHYFPITHENTYKAVWTAHKTKQESMGKNTLTHSFKQKHRKNKANKTELVFDEELRK